MSFAKTHLSVLFGIGIAAVGLVFPTGVVNATSTEEIKNAISGKSGTWHYRQRSGSIKYTSSSFSGSDGLRGTWKAQNNKYCFTRKQPNPETACVGIKIRKNGDIRLGNGVILKLK